jgi:hypothetical protein
MADTHQEDRLILATMDDLGEGKPDSDGGEQWRG